MQRDRTAGGKSSSSFLFHEATLLHQSGARDAAIVRYRACLAADPDNVEAIRLLGVAYIELGRYDEAITLFRKALRRAPKNALFHNVLGELMQAKGKLDDALQYFTRAIALQPRFAEAHAGRGGVLATLGRHDDAIASFDHAIAERPDFIEVHMNRGNSLRRLDRLDEAIKSYDAAIAVRDDLADAHFSRGLGLEDMDRFADAIESFDRALARAPDDPYWRAQLHRHRGTCHFYLGHLDAALDDARQSVRFAPDDDEAAYSASFIELLQGHWREAWPKFERRIAIKRTDQAEYIVPSFPLWNGEPLGDGLLVVRGEQGFGDQIQFAGFVAHLARRGLRVALWTKPALVPLLKSIAGIERVASRIEDFDTAADTRWIRLMSLPHALDTTMETIPQVVPYLAAEPDRVAQWRARLGTEGLKIGIVWQGNPGYRMDKVRSIPLREFAPLARIPNVRLISLQKGPGTEQIAGVPFASRIETFDESFDSTGAFLDSAAVMMNLDLLVTSDTATPHLAGALGCPLLMAIHRIPDWRWLIGRDDCPWYPSVRLFRQTQDRVWSDVFARIADTVGDWQQRSVAPDLRATPS